eukprot:3408954-Prymnesium_polylepis.1
MTGHSPGPRRVPFGVHGIAWVTYPVPGVPPRLSKLGGVLAEVVNVQRTYCDAQSELSLSGTTATGVSIVSCSTGPGRY